MNHEMVEIESQYRLTGIVLNKTMIQAFVITLREGLEAFLIIAISLAYLRKRGNRHLIPAVHWGIGASVVVSLGFSFLFARAYNQSLWEGVLGLAAAALVGSLTIHMWMAAKHIKHDIEEHLDSSSQRTGRGALIGVFVFTVFMISREGIETALLMNTLLFQVKSLQVIGGAVLGILCAAGVALLWSRYGHRVNLGLFFQVTAVFLLVFVVQLSIYGFHELTEAGVLPYSETLHWATEPYGPDGIYGKYLSYMLVLLPMGWLGFTVLGRKVSKAFSSA